jgi:AP2 domain
LGLPVRTTRRGWVMIASSNMALVDDLRQAGIIERKSCDGAIVDALLRTPWELRRHFVRGLFDGDGSAFDSANGRRVLELSGHPLMLENAREMAVQELGLAPNRLVASGAVGSFATLRWRHPLDVAKLTLWLYDGASIWLERKRAVLERPLRRGAASIYRGVYRHRSGRWAAKVGVGGPGGRRIVSAGVYDEEVSAARAYDRLVRKLLGRSAPVNLPESRFCDPRVLVARHERV